MSPEAAAKLAHLACGSMSGELIDPLTDAELAEIIKTDRKAQVARWRATLTHNGFSLTVAGIEEIIRQMDSQ